LERLGCSGCREHSEIPGNSVHFEHSQPLGMLKMLNIFRIFNIFSIITYSFHIFEAVVPLSRRIPRSGPVCCWAQTYTYLFKENLDH
jgi:hypothetical protein